MYRVFNLPAPPDRLTEYLRANIDQSAGSLRRRAVLARAVEGSWLLVCCTVEAVLGGKSSVEVVATRRYPEAILHEDWLTSDECMQFCGDLQRGHVMFGDVSIERKGPPSWQVELLPLKNIYMARAGYCVTTRFEERPVGIVAGPLLAPREPYYPDLAEAARDWLPFPVYHGDSDARRQEVIFLLPESRAFFADSRFKDGTLEISIEGTAVGKEDMSVKGAWWRGQVLQHFEGQVTSGRFSVSLPEGVDRLEYVLMDSRGLVYDSQREDRFSESGLGLRRLIPATQALAEEVRAACLEGESVNTEFKPFIDGAEGMGTRAKRTKLRELVMTVVSFANTHGGRIFLGIDKECCLSSISGQVQKWAKAEISDEIAYRYCRALTSKLRDQLIGDISLRLAHVFVDDALVVVVEVAQSLAKPAMVRDDNLLYVRAGASNRQVPPDQWENVLGRKASVVGLQLGAN